MWFGCKILKWCTNYYTFYALCEELPEFALFGFNCSKLNKTTVFPWKSWEGGFAPDLPHPSPWGFLELCSVSSWIQNASLTSDGAGGKDSFPHLQALLSFLLPDCADFHKTTALLTDAPLLTSCRPRSLFYRICHSFDSEPLQTALGAWLSKQVFTSTLQQ